MKISIRAGLQARGGSDVHPLKWAFEQGKELGFDGLELCMRADRNGFVTMMRPEWRSGIADLAKEYDMPILSLSGDWAWSYAVFNPTYKEWAQGVKFLAKDAELAQELGASTILVHFGTSQGPWEDGRALLDDLGLTYPTGTTRDADVIRGYGILGTPSTLFITPDGTVTQRWHGAATESQLEGFIEALLGASAG